MVKKIRKKRRRRLVRIVTEQPEKVVDLVPRIDGDKEVYAAPERFLEEMRRKYRGVSFGFPEITDEERKTVKEFMGAHWFKLYLFGILCYLTTWGPFWTLVAMAGWSMQGIHLLYGNMAKMEEYVYENI